MTISTNSLGPFIIPDVFWHTAQFLEIRDIAVLPQVCKIWQERFAETPSAFWSMLSTKEGIPLVEGEERNRRADFVTLYPITISGKRIGAIFGKVIGPIPCIRQEIFDSLKEEDPFEPGKLKQETFRFIVDPHLIQRTLDEETPLVLNEEGDLIEMDLSEDVEENVLIPFSLRNITTLCSYPLIGKQNMPVFQSFLPSILEQCNCCPDQVRIYFLRREVDILTTVLPYPLQEEQMQFHGFEVAPFRIRMLFDAVEILEKGTCPDDRLPCDIYNFARTSTTVCFGTEDCQVFIGGFTLGRGAEINTAHSYHNITLWYGTVPGCSAEVR